MRNTTSNITFNTHDLVSFIENIDRFELEEVKSLLQRESDHIDSYADAVIDADASFFAVAKIYDFFFDNCSRARRIDTFETIEYLCSMTDYCDQTKKDISNLKCLHDDVVTTRYKEIKKEIVTLMREEYATQDDCLKENSLDAVVDMTTHFTENKFEIVRDLYDTYRDAMHDIQKKSVFEIDVAEFIQNSIANTLSTSEERVAA